MIRALFVLLVVLVLSSCATPSTGSSLVAPVRSVALDVDGATSDLAAQLGCVRVDPLADAFGASVSLCTLATEFHACEIAVTSDPAGFVAGRVAQQPGYLSTAGDVWVVGGTKCAGSDMAALHM